MSTPNLEERFLEPQGWQWQSFERDGRQIRFGSVFPENAPDAIIVCLPGLSEFCEKYFETARNILARNCAFVVLDWMGQGLSNRYFLDSQKRHSHGFDHDVGDLHHLIMEHFKNASTNDIPMVMLAHSMGANIGSHYLHQHPDIFARAAMTAPMFGVQALNPLPTRIKTLIAGMTPAERYALGGHDWSEDSRAVPGDDAFSSDELRGAVHNAWCLANPDLQVGDVTYGWAYHALSSCMDIPFEDIQTHCLVSSAGQEDIVDNKAIEEAIERFPHATHLILPDARHEILMESDEIRNAFLDAFYQQIKETTIDCVETLKPS